MDEFGIAFDVGDGLPEYGTRRRWICAAEILAENDELLWNIFTNMEPVHGRLWIYDTEDQQTVAFTPGGVE